MSRGSIARWIAAGLVVACSIGVTIAVLAARSTHEPAGGPRRYSDYLRHTIAPAGPAVDQCSVPVEARSGGWVCYP